MKQIFLALMLIAVPVGLFAAYERSFSPAPMLTQASALGDMADLKTIAADTAALVTKGDLAGAQTRVTDFESAWDDQVAALQPKSPEDWGRVDAAADGAIRSLRAASPDAATATAALATLISTLGDPAGDAAASSGPQLVSGIAVTDAFGHPIPCEQMIKSATAALLASPSAAASDLNAKAIERCNADDDTSADAFSAQALAVLAAK